MLYQFSSARTSEADFSQWLNGESFSQWYRTNEVNSRVPKEQLLFCWACENGNSDLVKQMLWLLKENKIKIELNYNNDFGWKAASQNAHNEVLELLINFKDKDERTYLPVIDFNQYFSIAAQSNQITLMTFYLNLTEINPAFKSNEALRVSARRGHLEALTLLCSLKNEEEFSCDITANDHDAIRSSAFQNQLEIVKYLSSLYEERQIPMVQDDSFVNRALRNINKPK